jgi:hypothetical protein
MPGFIYEYMLKNKSMHPPSGCQVFYARGIIFGLRKKIGPKELQQGNGEG